MVLWTREFDLQYVICEAFLQIFNVIVWTWQPHFHSSMGHLSRGTLYVDEYPTSSKMGLNSSALKLAPLRVFVRLSRRIFCASSQFVVGPGVTPSPKRLPGELDGERSRLHASDGRFCGLGHASLRVRDIFIHAETSSIIPSTRRRSALSNSFMATPGAILVGLELVLCCKALMLVQCNLNLLIYIYNSGCQNSPRTGQNL